jgi:probable rRNA maturation factor
VTRRRALVVTEGIHAPPWRRRVPGFCARAIREAGFTEGEIGILLCGDARIRELNKRHRRTDAPTDVLSFGRGQGEAAAVEGDIVISLDALRRNAARYGASEDAELKRLLVHGILHLAGMDHEGGRGRGMLALQEMLLEALTAERIMEAPGGKK